jgi:hypothetical protein
MQRLGRAAPWTMKCTKQVVDGIPQLPSANPLFCCLFCDKAKMRKSHGSRRSTREAFVPGTSFHMDSEFIRGPKNLQEVLHNGATPKETIIKSQDGFSSYLLIIDAATQYIWTFLLKGKDPPIAIIDQFLNKHGTGIKGMITTTNGSDNQWKLSCTNQRCSTPFASIKATRPTPPTFSKILTLKVLESNHYQTIHTDNGGELAGSEDFRQVVGEHGYILETTAPDASNQSGLAEQPH